MKTKNFFLFLLIFISMSWSLKSLASQVNVYLQNTYTTERFYFCSASIDTVIVHKPTIAINTIIWTSPGGVDINGEDSVIITSINTGSWSFYSDEVDKFFHIYIISSPPIEPISMAHDTSFCTATFSLMLDAENQNPGGYAATYQWSTGATMQTITATTPGTYFVTVTNACGVGIYDITITQSNPNAPHLGADQSFCWGSSSVLDPGSTNVASYQWSTGATSPTIMVDTTGIYWVYLIDNNGCSGRDTVQMTALVPIGEQICFVEFDTTTWKNNVNWTSDLPGNADSVRIYKEDGINWMPIGTVYKTTTKFLDMASNPQAQSYSYRIAIIDTCGNESILSSHHKTITLLSTYDQPSNTYGFTWSYYEGLVVEYYYLYGIDASNNVYPVDTLNGSDHMYNYIGPNPAFVKYYVGFETPDCNGSKANVIVKSNWVDRDTLVTAMREENIISFSVYPNPADEQLNLTIDCKDFQVEISTMLGQVLLSEQNAKILNVGTLPQGIYIISITADGIKSNLRFIKN